MKTADAEKFWNSSNAEKADTVGQMLAKKEFLKLHALVKTARVIDAAVTKSFGDMFFDKFVTLMGDIKMCERDIVPFLLHCVFSYDDTVSWRDCALGYLNHLCKVEYDSILNYATENPNTALWRALVSANPELTTDYMLELLLEKKGKSKTVLREVLAETKLDVIPILEESYRGAPLPVKVGIVQLLRMFRKEADAVRVLEKIKKTEKSLTVLRLFGKGSDNLTFKYPCSYDGGIFSIDDHDESCRFKLVGSEIEVIEATENGLSLAKKAVKCRKTFLTEIFYTGDIIEINVFAEKIKSDALFAKLTEDYIFAVYNSDNYPIKLFGTFKGEIRPMCGEVDPENDEFMSIAHPAELVDSTLQYPTDGYFAQMKRGCFLPSKNEMRLSSIEAFGGAVIDAKDALKRAAEKELKVTSGRNINYFNARWGNYYCVYTFSAMKNTISLTAASFYDYRTLPVSGNKIIIKSAMPLTLEFVPVRIFSEFLSAVFYIMRGK